MTLKAEKFEELLTKELTSSLEPQRGKALAAFRAHVAAEAEKPVIAGSVKGGKEISRKEMWFWSSIPSVAAACLAVVVVLKMGGPSSPTPDPGSSGVSPPVFAGGSRLILTPAVEQTNVVTTHGGTVLVNDKGPQRQIREERSSTTQWQDGPVIYRLTKPEGETEKYEQLIPF